MICFFDCVIVVFSRAAVIFLSTYHNLRMFDFFVDAFLGVTRLYPVCVNK